MASKSVVKKINEFFTRLQAAGLFLDGDNIFIAKKILNDFIAQI